MSLVLKFEDTAALCCQVRSGVQRAESLIGDLKRRRWQKKWGEETKRVAKALCIELQCNFCFYIHLCLKHKRQVALGPLYFIVMSSLFAFCIYLIGLSYEKTSISCLCCTDCSLFWGRSNAGGRVFFFLLMVDLKYQQQITKIAYYSFKSNDVKLTFPAEAFYFILRYEFVRSHSYIYSFPASLFSF